MNNKEKFLLELLEKSDSVGMDEDNLFFHPKDINFEIKIPYNQCSNMIHINFILKEYNSDKKGVSLTFSSVDEAPIFMTEIYKRYNEYLNQHVNNTAFSQDNLNKIEEILKTPMDINNYRYFIDGQLESLIIRDNKEPHGLQINLGEAIYDYGKPINFNPLSYLVIDCFHKDKSTSCISGYKKIIPAFLIDKYKAISNIVDINKSTDNLHAITDALYKLDHNSGAVLTSMILNIELDNTNNKNKKNKI